MVRDESGEPSGRSGQGRGSLEEVQNGSGFLPEIADGSGNPRGGPKWVGVPPGVHDGSLDPRGGPR